MHTYRTQLYPRVIELADLEINEVITGVALLTGVIAFVSCFNFSTFIVFRYRTLYLGAQYY